MSLSFDAMKVGGAGLVYRNGALVGLTEEDGNCDVVRNTHEQLVKGQLDGAADESEEKVGKALDYATEFLVFVATGLGGAKFEVVAGRWLLSRLTPKNQSVFLREVVVALWECGGFEVGGLENQSSTRAA